MNGLSVKTTTRPGAVLILLLLLTGCTRPLVADPADTDVDPVLHLMRQRLLVMHDVARWKWNARGSITDPAREQTILADIVARSRQHDLDPAFVRAFFAAQFDAAKRLQANNLQRWETEQQRPFADVPDLVTELRPMIDRINGELLVALPAVRARLHDADAPARLRQRAAAVLRDDGITDAIRNTAIGPLVAPRP